MAFPIPPGFHPYPDNHRLFYASIGPLYLRHTAGNLQFGMSLEEKHMNAGMITHGGVLMYLMDMQLSLGGAFLADASGFSVTVQMNSDFLSATTVGDWLQGETRLVRDGRRLMFVDGTLTANGERLAMRANGIMTISKTVAAHQDATWTIRDLLPPEYIPGNDAGAGGAGGAG